MLRPKFYFKKINDIPKEFFRENNIKTILLDLDGTLAPAEKDDVAPETLEWLKMMKNEGVKLIIVSNNNRKRVKKFAEKVKLRFFERACKPTGKVLRQIKQRELDNICMIGDQVFTDVLGGNLEGFITVLIDPIEVGKTPIKASIVRFFEKPFRRERRV